MLTPSPIRSPSLSSTAVAQMNADAKFDPLVERDYLVRLRGSKRAFFVGP
jgi:hypothetical protein